MRLLIGILAIAFILIGQTPGRTETRVALVIGNSNYQNVSSLPNPANDAADMTAMLKQMGFTVREARDLGVNAMRETLAQFSDETVNADVALVFYAGHGMEVDKQNYLIPVDARLATDRRVRFEAIHLDDVTGAMEGVKGLSIVLLDACRNNPFVISMKKTSASRSVGRGLARVEPQSGSLIGFAAQAGTIADDGKGRNSPYTKALLSHLPEPGVDLRLTFAKVRDTVMKITGRAQQPFTYSSLPGRNIYLTTSQKPLATAPSKPTAATPGTDKETVFWNSIKDSKNPGMFDAYLKQFPSGTFAGIARVKLVELQKHALVGATPLNKLLPRAETGSLGPGSTFRDCKGCPEMVVVPPGSFVMGSPTAEKGRAKDEGPAHRISISRPFAVGKFEITLGEYTTFAKEAGLLTLSIYNKEKECWVYDKRAKWIKRQDRYWQRPGFDQDKTHPVVCVSWNDAMAYVKWLNGKVAGEPYRLLSEAEWEYAARAGTAAPYVFPAAGNQVCRFANGADQTVKATFAWANRQCSDNTAYTAPVGSFPANKFGLHDMIGNVWEWVADCWHDSYRNAPADGSAWVRGKSCGYKVLRGASWNMSIAEFRAANRSKLANQARAVANGFRVAKTLSP